MRSPLRALLAGSLGLASAFLVACGGGSGLLSGNQASSLNAQLDQVAAAVSSGDCGTATDAANKFVTLVSSLPRSVNVTLVNNLKQGASTVAVLAARDCHQTSTATTSSTTSSSTTTSTSSTPTTTSSTTTSSSTPTTTTSATSTTTSGTSSNGSGGGSGGAGLGGSGSGGAGTGGNGNGNGQ